MANETKDVYSGQFETKDVRPGYRPAAPVNVDRAVQMEEPTSEEPEATTQEEGSTSETSSTTTRKKSTSKSS